MCLCIKEGDGVDAKQVGLIFKALSNEARASIVRHYAEKITVPGITLAMGFSSASHFEGKGTTPLACRQTAD